jgi:hypothetical protein
MATQLEMFRSSWAVHVRLMAERIWKKSWFGWLLIGASASWYAWWCFHIPSPAKAATVLGFIAAVMVFRSEPGGIEKFFWTIVLFSFLLLEIKAIDQKDHLDEVARQTTESKEREARAQERTSFQELIATEQGLFKHETDLSNETTAQLTGGDTYAVVAPSLIPIVEPNTFPLSVFIGKNCKRRSIPDARIDFRQGPFDTSRQGFLDELSGKAGGIIYAGSIDPGWAQILQTRITPSLAGVTTYYINIFAKNKPSYETLQVRKNQTTGDWEYSYKIIREVVPASGPMTKGKYQTLEETNPTWQRTVFYGAK